jgi:hypothetical protein
MKTPNIVKCTLFYKILILFRLLFQYLHPRLFLSGDFLTVVAVATTFVVAGIVVVGLQGSVCCALRLFSPFHEPWLTDKLRDSTTNFGFLKTAVVF